MLFDLLRFSLSPYYLNEKPRRIKKKNGKIKRMKFSLSFVFNEKNQIPFSISMAMSKLTRVAFSG